MPWYFPWSESIKKRACRYILQHYLGQFLKEKLNLDQLSVDLFSGRGDVNNVLLDVVSLNETLETYNVPFEIIDGYIGNISVSIPWSGLLSENTLLTVNNLELTIQPKQRKQHEGTLPIDSMLFSGMTTSLQLAEECLKNEPTEGEQKADLAQPFEGLEVFAQTIDAVLSKVKVCLMDSVIRIEHVDKVGGHGAALEIKISRLEYFDDLAAQPESAGTVPGTAEAATASNAAVAVKNFQLMGVKIYCDDIPQNNHVLDIGLPSLQHEYEDCDDNDESDMQQSAVDSGSARASGSSDPGRGAENKPGPTKSELDPIPIMVLGGKQQLKLKLKQNEEMPGAKIELDCQFGSLNVYLTPHLVHLLYDIIEAVISPDCCADIKRKRRNTDPVYDLTVMDHELNPSSRNSNVSSYRHSAEVNKYSFTDEPYSMTSQSLDDSDDESYQCSNKTHESVQAVGSPPTGKTYDIRGADRHVNHQTSVSELSRIKLRVSMFSLIIAHEDPSPVSTDENGSVTLASHSTALHKLKEMAENFFQSVLSINASGIVSPAEMVKLRAEYSRICPYDHLGLLCKPVTLEIYNSSTNSLSTLSAHVSLGLTDLVEAVFERNGNTASLMGFHLPIKNVLPDYCELLTFYSDNTEMMMAQSMYASMHNTTSSCVKIQYKSSTSLSKKSDKKDLDTPITTLSVNLASCKCELDITIVDRIHALLKPAPWKHPVGSQASGGLGNMSVYVDAHQSFRSSQVNQSSIFAQAVSDDVKPSSIPIDVSIFSSCLTLDIRFPIVDLRTGQGLEKAWWKRNLSREILTFELKDAVIETSVRSSTDLQQFSLTCQSGRGLFLYDVGQQAIPFIRFSDSNTVSLKDGSDLPRLTVKIFPKKEMMWDELDNSCFQSVNYMSGLCDLGKSTPAPFSSRKVMYESQKMKVPGDQADSEMNSERHGVENEDFQELKMPGDRREMCEFEESSRNNTLLLIDINLPDVAVYIPDKSFTELLYNRLLNDLVLWEPAAPACYNPCQPTSFKPSREFTLSSGDVWSPDLVTQLTHQFNQPPDMYSFCKSNYSQGVSESDTDDDYMNESMTCGLDAGRSAHHESGRSRYQRQQRQQSKMCVELHIAQGFLSAALPLNEETDPETCERGEFVITLDNLKLFVSCGHNGDPEIHQMCLRTDFATLYHSGLIVGRRTVSCVDEAIAKGYDHLCKTIYPVEVKGGKPSVNVNEEITPMLSLALQINSDSFRNMKSYLVSLSLYGATLRYRMEESGRNWLAQIMELIDLVDYPIQGYTIPKVVTELYTHFISCAIDYRPLYLPTRALLTVEAFSISSNIIVDSAISVLRFVADDAALFLSDHLGLNEEGNINKDYVCIVNMGMFELTIRTCSSDNNKHPKFEMKASNDVLHIHTCADSFSALATLLQYLAGEEDMTARDSGSTPTPVMQKAADDIEKCGAENKDDNDEALEANDNDDRLLNDLMADAMQESCVNNPTVPPSYNTLYGNEGRQHSGLSNSVESDISSCHTYPSRAGDMNRDIVDSSSSLQLSSSSSEMADYFNSNHTMNTTLTAEEDDNDDFCMVDEPGLRYAKHNGEPIIKCYTDEPVQIISNHFGKPLGKVDLLKSPDHFPLAEYRYTLKDMSIVWSMYGGSDFQQAHSTTEKTKRGMNEPLSNESIDKRLGRYRAGGPMRDLNTVIEVNLNKVRFQHESFGKDQLQASRQVLLINEIEIKDRLSSSNINKFLYLYSSESMPRQSQANMLMIKALHTRSEPNSLQQECSIKISLQPLRLNIDQDALFFLRKFFTDLTSDGRPEQVTVSDIVTTEIAVESGSSLRGRKSGEPTTGVTQLSSSPRRCDKELPSCSEELSDMSASVCSQADQQQMLMMFSQMEGKDSSLASDTQPVQRGPVNTVDTEESNAPVFFKSVLFSPEVPIRLDYQGKWVDMEQGTIVGLLIGLAQLNCSELRLKRVHHRHGILGADRLMTFLANEWLQDIKKNQIPSLLGGVGPLYSLVQLVQGCKDLVWLPVEQYRKDGRIVRGIQRGTHSFMTCTAMSTLELTNRLVQSVQFAAEIAFDVVSPGPGVRARKKQARKQLSHPTDLRAGVTNAYTIVTEGLYDAANDIYRVAITEHENKGTVGAVGGILRHMPSAVIEPVIIASEATSNVLGGMRNQLLPDRRKEDEEKWKTV